jgi:hypothetical protein
LIRSRDGQGIRRKPHGPPRKGALLSRALASSYPRLAAAGLRSGSHTFSRPTAG